jgi:hypothetical protein
MFLQASGNQHGNYRTLLASAAFPAFSSALSFITARKILQLLPERFFRTLAQLQN